MGAIILANSSPGLLPGLRYSEISTRQILRNHNCAFEFQGIRQAALFGGETKIGKPLIVDSSEFEKLPLNDDGFLVILSQKDPLSRWEEKVHYGFRLQKAVFIAKDHQQFERPQTVFVLSVDQSKPNLRDYQTQSPQVVHHLEGPIPLVNFYLGSPILRHKNDTQPDYYRVQLFCEGQAS